MLFSKARGAEHTIIKCFYQGYWLRARRTIAYGKMLQKAICPGRRNFVSKNVTALINRFPITISSVLQTMLKCLTFFLYIIFSTQTSLPFTHQHPFAFTKNKLRAIQQPHIYITGAALFYSLRT